MQLARPLLSSLPIPPPSPPLSPLLPPPHSPIPAPQQNAPIAHKQEEGPARQRRRRGDANKRSMLKSRWQSIIHENRFCIYRKRTKIKGNMANKLQIGPLVSSAYTYIHTHAKRWVWISTIATTSVKICPFKCYPKIRHAFPLVWYALVLGEQHKLQWVYGRPKPR